MYGNPDKSGLLSEFIRISIHFFVNFLRFQMPVSQSKLARLTPNLGICESRCALSDYVDQ